MNTCILQTVANKVIVKMYQLFVFTGIFCVNVTNKTTTQNKQTNKHRNLLRKDPAYFTKYLK